MYAVIIEVKEVVIQKVVILMKDRKISSALMNIHVRLCLDEHIV
jgi:hypothetical protein